MKTFAFTILLSAAVTSTAMAGTVSGTVRAQGKSEVEESGSDGKYDSRKYKFVEKVNYSELRDFVVYVEEVSGQPSAPPEKPVTVDTRRIAQKGATFAPHVLPVVVGTTVEWPNNDDIFHNVFSMSETKPFDLQLYKGNPPDKKVTFDKLGRVDVFCSIHANMHCIVLVLQNPYYAVVDSHGHFAINDLPPGTYKLKAWHERLPAQTKDITVPETGDVKADFVLGINNLPKY